MSNVTSLTLKSELAQTHGIMGLLTKVRPQWQTKSLIDRVRRLLEVDPSSACQRLFNAAVHDLREKVVIAGVDIASEAAKQNRLPPISSNEDVENYSTSKLIDLVYHMGLISRPEWRRVCRCYEIRRDLEHEDDEYEAGIEDCVYIFNTCVDVILSADPVHLLKVKDVKTLVEQTVLVSPDASLLADYERAPQPRQEEIIKFLLSVSLDKTQLDLVQQNTFAFLQYLQPLTHSQVKLKIGGHLQDKLGRDAIDIRMARVAQAIGVFPYLRQVARRDFFAAIAQRMENIGTHWMAHAQHGDILRDFIECGAFDNCTEAEKLPILKWMVVTYMGTPGGVTQYGNVRHVYYSNVAAPLITDIISSSASIIGDLVRGLNSDADVNRLMTNQHIARRYEKILDMIETV